MLMMLTFASPSVELMRIVFHGVKPVEDPSLHFKHQNHLLVYKAKIQELKHDLPPKMCSIT